MLKRGTDLNDRMIETSSKVTNCWQNIMELKEKLLTYLHASPPFSLLYIRFPFFKFSHYTCIFFFKVIQVLMLKLNTQKSHSLVIGRRIAWQRNINHDFIQETFYSISHLKPAKKTLLENCTKSLKIF